MKKLITLGLACLIFLGAHGVASIFNSAIFRDTVEIEGSQDAVQLNVQGNSTQTSDVARLGDPVESNYTSIDSCGTVMFNGEATVYDDLRAPATTISIFGFGTDPDFDATNLGYLFDDSSTEILRVILQLPHAYKEGSDVEIHVHWQPTNTNTGNVRWEVDYKWTNINDTDAGSTTNDFVLDAGDGTAFKHQVASFGGTDGTGKTISSILSVTFSRVGGDASDTYVGDALLKEVDVHYEINTIGSRTVTGK